MGTVSGLIRVDSALSFAGRFEELPELFRHVVNGDGQAGLFFAFLLRLSLADTHRDEHPTRYLRLGYRQCGLRVCDGPVLADGLLPTLEVHACPVFAFGGEVHAGWELLRFGSGISTRTGIFRHETSIGLVLC